MNIVITGFMASGKSVVSRELAYITERKLIDTDDMIVESCGMSINEIFESYGEDYFRNIEHEAVKKAANCDNTVIATGGGVVLDKRNMTELRKNGLIINLSPDFDVIKSRLAHEADTRPLVKNKSIEEIKKQFDERLPMYAQCDFQIYVNDTKTVKDCVAEILNVVKRYI